MEFNFLSFFLVFSFFCNLFFLFILKNKINNIDSSLESLKIVIMLKFNDQENNNGSSNPLLDRYKREVQNKNFGPKFLNK